MAMKCKPTQDASKRLVNFYLDEADAYRLQMLCDERGQTRTQFLSGLVASLVSHIKLTDEDNAEINRVIQKRIDAGYPKNFRAESRYHRV